MDRRPHAPREGRIPHAEREAYDREPKGRTRCPCIIAETRSYPPGTEMMDAHTLGLLEFDKVHELLAGYSACSLGKELARQLEPSADADKVRAELALVTEMSEALALGQSPPFGGLHDVR